MDPLLSKTPTSAHGCISKTTEKKAANSEVAFISRDEDVNSELDDTPAAFVDRSTASLKTEN